MSWRKFWLNF